MKQNRRPAPFNVAQGDTEGTTWALPEGAIARLGKGEHAQPGGDVKLSPDGTYFAAATDIGLWWYDVSGMSPIALWETERGGITAIDFSSDGKHISIANWDSILKVMDVQSGETITRIEKEDRYVHIVFSPDSSRWVVADSSGIIQVLDVKTGQGIVQMDRGVHEFQSNDVSQLEFSPNGQYIAGAVENPELYRDGKVINPDTEGRQTYIWCSETGVPFAKFAGRNFAFSPDSRLLACATHDETTNDGYRGPRVISVFDVAKGERSAYFTEHATWVHTVTFSPCGQFLASCDTDKMLCVWDLSKGTLKETYTDCGTPFYTQDSVLLTATRHSGSIEVKAVERGETLQTIELQFGSIGYKWFSKCPELAIAHTRSDERTKTTIQTFPTLHEPTTFPDPMLFLPDGKTLASRSDARGIVLWDIKRQQPTGTLLKNTRIASFTVLPCGNILAAYSQGNKIQVWDAEKPDAPIAEFTETEQTGVVWSLAFSPIGDRLALGSKEGPIYLWDFRSSEKLKSFTGHTELISSVKFSPDGSQLVSTSNDNTARVWDIPTCAERGKLPKAEDIGVMRTVFSPCGKLIAGGLFGELRWWCAETLTTLHAIPHPQTQRLYALTFSPCGRYLASGTWWQKGMEKMAISLWDVASGENITTFWGHPTDIQSLAFSPDGTLLASGGFDRTILLWDLKPFIGS